MTLMGIGFNQEILCKRKSIYENYIGKAGIFSVHDKSVTGVLKEINLEMGYILVQPSIVSDGYTHIRLERKFPSVLGFDSEFKISVIPWRKQDLENYVKEFNLSVDSSFVEDKATD